MFDDGLKTIGSQIKRKVCDIYVEMSLAMQKGGTDRQACEAVAGTGECAGLQR